MYRFWLLLWFVLSIVFIIIFLLFSKHLVAFEFLQLILSAVELHGSQGTPINRENPILLLIYGTMNLIKRKKWRACMIVNFEGVFKCRCWKAMHHSLLSSFGRCLLCYVEMKIPMHHNSRDFFFRDFILLLIFLKFMLHSDLTKVQPSPCYQETNIC